MNEKLAQALSDIISSAGAAKGFLLGQAPEVLRQVLLWHFAYNMMLFTVSLILLPILAYLNYRQVKYWMGHKELFINQAEAIFFWNLLQVPPIVGCCCSVNFTWLKILIAPKLYLIEFASSFIK